MKRKLLSLNSHDSDNLDDPLPEHGGNSPVEEKETRIGSDGGSNRVASLLPPAQEPVGMHARCSMPGHTLDHRPAAMHTDLRERLLQKEVWTSHAAIRCPGKP